MRLFELFPPTACPPGLMRRVDDLSGPEWTNLIGVLGDLAEQYLRAEEKATEEWARRYPRENYATAGEWYEAIGYELEGEGEGSERTAGA